MKINTDEAHLVPVRGLNEYAYCPRLYHLMYVQGLFEDSVETLEGRINHEKPMTKTKAASSQEDKDETLTPWPISAVQQITLSSETLGIIGKFDVLLDDGECTIPVEVKHGKAPDGITPFYLEGIELSPNAWVNDQIQLAAQMALLQENAMICTKGRLYYRQSRKLVEIVWDDNLKAALKRTAEQCHMLQNAPMPVPLQESAKCIRCSLNHVCLPDETLYLNSRIQEEPRRLFPGRDDMGILHLTTPGARIGKAGGALRIMIPDEDEINVPIKDIAHVCVWGNAQISTQAVLDLVERGASIAWLTGGGWLRAVTLSPTEKNVELRRRQYQAFEDTEICFQLSRKIVEAKIENQRTLVRRNGDTLLVESVIDRLKECRQRIAECDSIESLRGIEGFAARNFWEAFPHLLKEKARDLPEIQGRNRRPPRDPVNTLLSFGYSMLLRDFLTALHSVGMDPMFGFYHALVPGRPALALDIMEPFRALVVDSAVLRSINEGTLSKKDFICLEGSCTLKPNAKKRWIQAYERRVDELVTHPVFGYRLSYRRVFTLEARLLGRFLMGELPDYSPLTTR